MTIQEKIDILELAVVQAGNIAEELKSSTLDCIKRLGEALERGNKVLGEVYNNYKRDKTDGALVGAAMATLAFLLTNPCGLWDGVVLMAMKFFFMDLVDGKMKKEDFRGYIEMVMDAVEDLPAIVGEIAKEREK